MERSDKPRELIVIGGSAGSLSVVMKIIRLLKKEMNFAIVIVFHRKQSEDDTLIEILGKRTDFRVKEADDKDDITPGVIYVAPADYHLLIEKNKVITLDDSEKVNYSRPSIDVTFESAADVFGDRLVCILLSGANADGAEGLKKAKSAGALVVVQDPATAEVPFMPAQALLRVNPDLIFSLNNIEKLIDTIITR
jgi:two-component system chemotaxis response regulator CheB